VPLSIAGGGLTAVARSRGGRIVSLTGPGGREWLAQSNGKVEGPRFVDADLGGWDECAPSIDACDVDGRSVPDHGDLWATTWTIDKASPAALTMSARGDSLGYRIERKISATASGLLFEYRAEAEQAPTPFLWAAHPQFASPPGSFVRLPASVDSVVDVLDGDTALPWTSALATVDTLPVGGCRKVYVDPAVAVGEATLVRADGSELTMTWTGCPYLGLWFDNRAYAAEPVVAIEPSTGFRDSLAFAIGASRASMLLPGRPLRWSLELRAT
jgi:galactose mutarotase-like enzyme